MDESCGGGVILIVKKEFKTIQLYLTILNEITEVELGGFKLHINLPHNCMLLLSVYHQILPMLSTFPFLIFQNTKLPT